MPEGFAELERRDGRTVMCPRCGRHPVNGNVQIAARRKVGPANANTKQVASTQLSMCERCIVAVFLALEENLHAVVEFDSRAGKDTADPRRR